ncbi:MAG: DNA-protecting protein DprA [Candidatus Aquicultor secundus]|uniref:DNA-processing protein DprA n=1 Tax=Candidatus Aquicultor secundus TaxID=1973895 RepID=UPI000CBF5CA7|nr:DNA-processing protein DprA [Candidatus Aquicultor secundus]PIU26903.1 MAG: DNA-protecting protein DprA [Candidatus Aquicultor secundus]PIW22042.1 MAG: DNA-protecting protein DprA [Candidatus Aquicultor secundus]
MDREIVTNNKKYWLGVKMIPGLRNRIYVLADRAGGPQHLWEAGKDDLIDLGLDKQTAGEVIAERKMLDLDRRYADLTSNGIDIITTEDNEYPRLLKEAPYHPKALFVKGRLADIRTAVAIVGARRATARGKAMAEELASEIAAGGVAIVSGAARGIDTSGHRGALDAGGTTYAVLGCGLDMVYPPENKNLFKKIIENGALISEYPPGTPPLSHHFPVRNRIVAGMCQAVVVVEAGLKSGALITADFALDYGRDVLAVPGFSKSDVSRGANRLIKQGAYLVESAEDVLSLLGVEHVLRPQTDALNQIEKDFLEIMGWEAQRLDDLTAATGASIASVSALLLTLEISGFIKRDISGSYIRLK